MAWLLALKVGLGGLYHEVEIGTGGGPIPGGGPINRGGPIAGGGRTPGVDRPCPGPGRGGIPDMDRPGPAPCADRLNDRISGNTEILPFILDDGGTNSTLHFSYSRNKKDLCWMAKAIGRCDHVNDVF
jgi:hypothetical protein